MISKLLILLCAGALCGAQTGAAPPARGAEAPGGALKIQVIAGEGANNNVTARVGAQPAVEVRDEKGQPVQGAEVVFTLPPAGPGGVFFGWLRTNTVRTDAQGQARASGFTPNGELGPFQIAVRASLGGRTGEAAIRQTNTEGPSKQMKSNRRALWTVVGLAVAGGVIGGVAAARNGNDTPAATPPTPVTIGAGPITVGGPR